MMQLRQDTKTLVIIAGFSTYAAPDAALAGRRQLQSLEQIPPTVARLQSLLELQRYSAEGIQVVPLGSVSTVEEVRARLKEIRQTLQQRAAAGLNLVLFWSGHGGLDGRYFRLATPDAYAPIEQEDGMSVDEVLREAGVARVGTCTVFLDTCHAGAGLEDIFRTVSNQFVAEAPTLRGFGALFASAPYERARDSVFLNTVIDVLERGPSSAAMSRAESLGGGSFNPYNRLLSVAELFEAVPAEYESDPLRFRQATAPTGHLTGSTGLRFLPNPQYRKHQPSRLVEEVARSIARGTDLESHFFPKAVGIDSLETGWHFTGRVDATRAILQWMTQAPPPGPIGHLYVLAADGGTGKSALLGRLISLSDPTYRSKAKAQGWAEVADRPFGTVPEPDQIDAALNLRSLTAQTAADHLAEILMLPKGDTVEAFVKSAPGAYSRKDGRFTCLVLDALDEAEDPATIVYRLIRPLVAAGWKVLTATRPSSQSRGAGDLLAALGEATVYRLDQDTQSWADIQAYVYGRLRQHDALRAVAEAAARLIADRAASKFLFARMATSALLRGAPQVTPANFESFISLNTAAALEREIGELDVAFRQRFSRTDTGASAMLTALAWAQGEGVPIRDGVWAAMASAIALVEGPSEGFKDEHLLWLLREAGRYIQEAGDGEQAVYRFFHKLLIEHFLAARSLEQRNERLYAERVAQALVECVRASQDWRYTNAYLIRHLPAHLAARPEQKGLNRLLLNFDWIQARLRLSGIDALLSDYLYCNNAYPATGRLHRTLSMVSHILRHHPEQLVPQLLGRIAPGVPDLRPLLEGQAGANYGLPPPTQEGLSITERLMMQTPQLDIERRGPWLIDHTLRLDGLLERARASIQRPTWVPELGGLAQAGALIRILAGHWAHVYFVAFSPNGKTVISGGRDGTLRVWDARTGAVLHTLTQQGDRELVCSGAVSPDGQTIVSGSWGLRVRVWDANTGTESNTPHALQGHEGDVRSMNVSPDGRTIVSGSHDSTVRVWDAQTGAALHTLQGQEGVAVHSVAVSPDGNTIVSGNGKGVVRVWDVHTGAELHTLQGEQGQAVSSVAVSPDGKVIVSGSREGAVRVWDAQTGAALHTLKGHEESVSSVAVSLDGKIIVSGSFDRTVRVWDLHTGAALSLLSGSDCAAVLCVAVSPDGNTVVSGSGEGAVRVWDARTRVKLHTRQGHEGDVSSLAVSPDGKTIVSGSDDQTVRVWDAQTGTALHSLLVQEGRVNSVAVSPDGKTIISGGNNQPVRVWNAHTGAEVNTLQVHEGDVNSVAVSPDGKTIISGSRDGTVSVWNAHTGAALYTLQVDPWWLGSLVVSPDGRNIVLGGSDQSVRVLDARTGAALHTLQGHDRGGEVRVAVSPDGRTVVSCGYDRTVRVWDAYTGAALHTLRGHEHVVNCVAVSPDCRTIVSGGEDLSVRVWDANTGAVLQRLDFDAPVNAVSFEVIGSPSRLVVAAGRSVIRLVRRDPEATMQD